MKKIPKPELVDTIIHNISFRDTTTEISGKWYIKKPLSPFMWKNVIKRLYHALLIIKGNAFAVQYMEDRIER